MATIYTRAGKGSALTWTEADNNITNLNTDKIENVVDDTSPQLGGNLDVNGNSIVSASNGDIAITPNGTGNIVLDGQKWPQADGTSNQILKTDGSGQLSWTTVSGGITDVVQDTTPQLGGDLDVNGKVITSASAGNVVVRPAIGGNVNIEALSTGNIALTPATGKIILGALDFPTGTGSNGQVLTTNGSTGMSWTTVSGGIASVSADTSPMLGGNLNLAGYSINNSINSNTNINALGTGNINLTPATGKVVIDGLSWPTADGTTDQVLKTDGAGNLSFTTVSSGVTVSDDTSTNATRYITFEDVTSGSVSTVNVSSTKLTFNPSLGRLTTTQVVAALDGIVGSVTPAAGTFTSLTANTSASLKAITEGALYDLGTTGGTVAPNVANGNVQKITLNSALTINAFTSPVAGQSLTLIIYGGTAYTSITSTMKFAGGVKTLTGTAGCIDILSVYYDGTNYFASLGKGFA